MSMYDKNVNYEETAWNLLYKIEEILGYNEKEVVDVMKDCRFHEDDIKEYKQEKMNEKYNEMLYDVCDELDLPWWAVADGEELDIVRGLCTEVDGYTKETYEEWERNLIADV